MAKNLLSHLSAADSLIVHDVNTESTSRFVQECKTAMAAAAVTADVKVAEDVRAVAEKAVRGRGGGASYLIIERRQ